MVTELTIPEATDLSTSLGTSDPAAELQGRVAPLRVSVTSAPKRSRSWLSPPCSRRTNHNDERNNHHG